MAKNIVVLGGGTAGWLTALFCNQTFPTASVTLIENTAIGAVGVGEGSSLALPQFLDKLGIDSLQVMKESNGSVKTGISFENWNGDSKKYFHSFRGEDVFSIPPHFPGGCDAYHMQTLIKNGLDVNEHIYATRLAYCNKLDFELPMAMHFDAYKFATCLKNIAKERGIVCVDGNCSHVEVDENNFIEKICLDGGIDFACDFAFDCSGFARLLIGGYYQTAWTDYQDFLPMKKAITFRLDVEEEIKPYTQSIAMGYGWMWKIAIQDRIGSGYVFDSDYLNEEDAVAEAEKILGQKLDSIHSIPFNAGTYQKFWVQNCISVGLSSTFVEPLEATSIDVIITQLDMLKGFVNHIFKYDENSVDSYNRGVCERVELVSHFIYVHYLTKRNDTEFWRTFKERHPAPKKFERLLRLLYQNNLRESDFGFLHYTFRQIDWLEICNGLELFEKPMDMDGYENLTPSIDEYKEWCDARISSPDVVSCSDFLREVRG